MTLDFVSAVLAHIDNSFARVGMEYQGGEVSEKKDGTVKISFTLSPRPPVRVYEGKKFRTNYDSVVENIESRNAAGEAKP